MPARKRILLICQDLLGPSMAGPAIRSYHFAQELAKEFDVTLVHTQPTEPGFTIEGVRLVSHNAQYRWLERFAAGFDAVITQPLRLHAQHALVRAGVPVIYDMYVPSVVETLASQSGEDAPLGRRELAYDRTRQDAVAALSSAAAVICASERQRDLWLGALGTLGRLDIASFQRDPGYRSLVRVVPFGLPDDEPTASGEPAMRNALRSVDDDSFIMLWAGGIWNWFDPVTVIEGVKLAHQQLPHLRLVFLGTQHPNADVKMRRTRDAIDAARAAGLDGSVVHFVEGWVPYDRRADYLLEANVGVSAHFDNVESRFSFRTRFLDHLWAGLPTLTTHGSPLSDLVEELGLGRTVSYEDPHAWAQVILDTASNTERLQQMRAATLEAATAYTWSSVGDQLATCVHDVLAGTPAPPQLSLVGRMPRYAKTQASLQGVSRSARKLMQTLRS